MVQRNAFLTGTMMAVLALGMAAGCSSDGIDADIDDNKGSKLTTAPGSELKEEQLLGKWDLDGERTDRENGHSGAGAIGSNVFKDMFGAGWKFEPKGVIKFDKTGGYTTGSYKIQGSRLLIRYTGGIKDYTYEAQFKDGYLCLLDVETKTVRVFEKSKFFDF